MWTIAVARLTFFAGFGVTGGFFFAIAGARRAGLVRVFAFVAPFDFGFASSADVRRDGDGGGTPP